MLRHDKTAHYEPAGLFGAKARFVACGVSSSALLGSEQAEAIIAAQLHEPIEVHHEPGSRRTWWLFQDDFYWEDDGLSSTEVKALVLERQRKKRRQIERAVAAMEGSTQAGRKRERIPESVQATVWNRDEGKCVSCGSSERLEFDHIIPHSRGGSDTARNLQLLCERCNRSKGANFG